MSDDFRNRIAIRAYYAAQNDGYARTAEAYWLYAERYEMDIIHAAQIDAKRAKRSEAAKRGAATRKANRDAVAVRTAFQASLARRAAHVN